MYVAVCAEPFTWNGVPLTSLAEPRCPIGSTQSVHVDDLPQTGAITTTLTMTDVGLLVSGSLMVLGVAWGLRRVAESARR